MATDNDIGVSKQFVVYICEDGRVESHGGPYAPMKAREVRDAMRSHVERENHRDWNIPEDTLSVETVTREKLRELRTGSNQGGNYGDSR